MKQKNNPAPALTRGLALIRQLSREGQGVLEHLARRGGWPKSSTLRYLQALEMAGVVEQDPLSKVWHLRERLIPLETREKEGLGYWRTRLGGWCQELGHCLELYRVRAGMVELMDRADPVIQDHLLSARIGFVRDLSECEAIALIYFAFSCASLDGEALNWMWSEGNKRPVGVEERQSLLKQAGDEGMAVDLEFNRNGIRRFALALTGPQGAFTGILAIAQRLTPLSASQTPEILRYLEFLQSRHAALAVS